MLETGHYMKGALLRYQGYDGRPKPGWVAVLYF